MALFDTALDRHAQRWEVRIIGLDADKSPKETRGQPVGGNLDLDLVAVAQMGALGSKLQNVEIGQGGDLEPPSPFLVNHQPLVDQIRQTRIGFEPPTLNQSQIN